jgi:hypothetical protein
LVFGCHNCGIVLNAIEERATAPIQREEPEAD